MLSPARGGPMVLSLLRGMRRQRFAGSVRKTIRRNPLTVERLEGRDAPAVDYWIGGATDNLASSAANWSNTPVAGDTLVFDSGSIKPAEFDAAFLSSVAKAQSML